MRILMVHGIAQGGRNEAELKQIWTETLQEGFDAAGKRWPRNVTIDLPFYGDMLASFVAEAELPAPATVLAKGAGQDLDFARFMQSALDQMQSEGRISDAQVREQLPAGSPQQKGPQNWGWVQAIVRVIDNRLTPLSNFTIELFLREVFLYVARRPVADAINARVVQELTDEPTIVIGHSLGSVVAYNVLKANRARIDLRRFITVGSPLGLRAVSGKLGVASNVADPMRWFNAYDAADIVALNPLDRHWFPVDPKIKNHGIVKNNTDNRHGIIGYLNDAKVAAEVAAALR